MIEAGLPDAVVRQLTDIFSSYPAIRRVMLYGSRAKGTHRNGSDIDLCIEAPDMTLSELLEIEGRIDDLLIPWKVDLSLMHRVENPDLLEHIRRAGKVFYVGRDNE